MGVGEGRNWSWISELKYRKFRQRETVWQDSLRGWLHTHRAQMTNWKGWIFSGSYTHGEIQIGSERQQTTHLGRVRLGHNRPGSSHQITYRVSSTRVSQPIFVEVAPGLGEYIWEDANGDGLRDVEEFVPDVDGDYVRVYDYGEFAPARDGALGMRVEIDFRRLIGNEHILSAVALDASLRAERQIAVGTKHAAPWDLFGFDADAGILGARRDGLVRLYLFRYHRRGSLRLTARVRDQVNRAFYGGAAEFFVQGGALGKLRPVNRLELETEFDLGHRAREGAGAFAYRIDGARGALRCAFRSARNWYLRLGVLSGRDWEGVRALRVWHVGVQPEVIYALPGRGRLRGAIELDAGLGDGYSTLIFGVGKGQSPGAELGVAIGDGLPFWQICIGAGDVRWARKARSSDDTSRARGDAGGFLIRRHVPAGVSRDGTQMKNQI